MTRSREVAAVQVWSGHARTPLARRAKPWTSWTQFSAISVTTASPPRKPYLLLCL